MRSPQLLALIRDWFDMLWENPTVTSVNAADGGAPLTTAQYDVLRQLAAGRTDEAIARSLGTSVRTVRRHIGATLDALGVNTRFAAGAAAAKRGWI